MPESNETETHTPPLVLVDEPPRAIDCLAYIQPCFRTWVQGGMVHVCHRRHRHRNEHECTCGQTIDREPSEDQ